MTSSPDRREALVAPGGRLPSLDGLRAISILFVIIHHLHRGFPGVPAWAEPLLLVVGNADFGVTVFFGISGFLITWLLLGEQDRTGRIDLKGFYIRRAYRIWPAFYTMIAVAVILVLLGVIVIPWRDVLVASAFLWNYVPPKGEGWWIGHSWSLAVEEQFYLLWPAALACTTRLTARRLAFALVLLSPVVRIATYFLMPGSRPYIGAMLHTRADSLMFGCSLALLLATPAGAAFVRRLVALRLHLPAIGFVVLVSPFIERWKYAAYMVPVGWTVISLCIAIAIAAAVLEPRSRFGRMLNTRLLTAIGVRSYSLYLWQQFFTQDFVGVPDAPLVLRIVATFAAAELSYRCIELPVLALRQRRHRIPRALDAVDTQAAGAG